MIKDKKEKENRISKLGITAIVIIISGIIMLITLIVIYKPFSSDKTVILAETVTNETPLFTPEEKEELISTQNDFEKEHIEVIDEDMVLLKMYQDYNSDCVGIISIEDSLLNHPLMQSPEDEGFYLYHDLDKNYNSHGIPFLSLDSDLSKDCGNNIIYGHNIRAHDRDIFADFEFYENIEYYIEHPVIKIVTDKGTHNYIIFAYYLIDTSDGEFVYWDDTDWGDYSTYKEYMEEVEKRNWLDTDVPYSYNDQFITLSSCSVELAHSKTNKMVIMARLLDVDEEYSTYIENAQMRENPRLPKKLR